MRPLPLALPALLLVVVTLGACSDASAPEELPDLPGERLLAISDLEYVGAFRLPAGRFGASELNYSQGPLLVQGSSLYIVGHTHEQAVAEFGVPPLVRSEVLQDLSMAAPPRQPFQTLLDRAGANPQSLNRIAALALVDGPAGPELLVNAYEYYDAPGDNTHTTLVVRSPGELAGSRVDGFFSLEGAAHAVGWISQVPPEWQSALGGSWIAGGSSGMPIIARLSVGPSAFIFDPVALTGNAPPGPVPAEAVLDYDLGRPLHGDLSNESGSNSLWTHLSRAVYGFIPPGTRTYLVLGSSGGHRPGGVCYKCVPSGESHACSGYCAVDSTDYTLSYWLYDVEDLVKVRQGALAPHQVRPYAHGPFVAPFATGEMGGGSFDAETGLLYLTMQRADRAQGAYANPPVIVAFRVRD